MSACFIASVALTMALLGSTAADAREPAVGDDEMPSGGQCSAFQERVAGFIVEAALCGSCHERAYLEHRSSGHAVAGSSPAFLAEWARARADDPSTWSHCLVCHSPTVLGGSESASLAPSIIEEVELPGVTCEACHASVGFLGEEPGGGNLIACPGEPRSVGRGHSRVEEFQRGSELCAACHQWENAFGVTVLDTYREWQASSEAALGQHCQACHASPAGFLFDGAPTTLAGEITRGSFIDEPTSREDVHSHEYPGSRWPAQLRGALELEILPLPLAPDGRLSLEVVVSNPGAGHAVPTGWTALRLLWLEVEVDGQPVAAQPAEPARPWDVAGATAGDPASDPAAVPPGSRLYRSVYGDLEGRPTTEVWKAAELVFDNRIGPDEERRERYEVMRAAPGAREITARLRFLSRPAAWSRERGVAPARPVLLAEEVVRVGPGPE